jgi:Tol biopolymer transport system component
VGREDSGQGDLWDVNLTSGIFSRLTTHAGLDSDPSWSPDERSLVFSSIRGGRQAVFVKDLVSGKEDQLVALEQPAVVDEWTPDGRYVILRTRGHALYSVSMLGDRTPRLLVDTPYVEDEVHVSPDGHWVAFNADESGRWEVYIAAFPTFTSKRQVSNGGGVQPQWRRDGRELFYLGPDGSMMSVRLDTGTELAPGAPARLFPTNIQADPSMPQYAVTADGQRFLGLEPVGGVASFTFLFNWLNDLPSTATRPVH